MTGQITSIGNDVAAGSLSVVIDQVFGYTTNTTVDVLEIGDLKFDFDIAESETDATSIYSRIGDSTLKIRNTLGNGDDFFNTIKLISTNPFRVKFELVANSGSTYDFYFYAFKNDVRIVESDRHCSIKLRPIYYGGKGGGDYFNGTIENVDPSAYLEDAYIDNEENTQVVASGRFIRDALKSFSGVNDLILISDAHQDITSFSNGVTYNLVGDPFPPSGDTLVDPDGLAVSMLEVLLNFAGEEGAIFGSSFSKNFYVKRASTNNKVTLTFSDIEDIETMHTDYQYATITVVSSGGTSYDGVTQLSDNTTTTYNSLSNRTFSFTSRVTLGLNGQWRTNVQLNPPIGNYVNNVFYLGADGQGTDVDTTDSVSGYAAALGADLSDRVELTVFGFDKILPWTPFEISSSTDVALPSGVSSRHSGIVFRPTSLVYSFNDDKVKVKAYKIA